MKKILTIIVTFLFFTAVYVQTNAADGGEIAEAGSRLLKQVEEERASEIAAIANMMALSADDRSRNASPNVVVFYVKEKNYWNRIHDSAKKHSQRYDGNIYEFVISKEYWQVMYERYTKALNEIPNENAYLHDVLDRIDELSRLSYETDTVLFLPNEDKLQEHKTKGINDLDERISKVIELETINQEIGNSNQDNDSYKAFVNNIGSIGTVEIMILVVLACIIIFIFLKKKHSNSLLPKESLVNITKNDSERTIMENEALQPTIKNLQGNKYKIVRRISSGGFGNTYEALDVNLDKKVAIKEFFVKDFCTRESDTTLVTITGSGKRPLILHLKQKFMEEARAIAKMEHENIVKVQALFEENGTAYYVMDYIEGESLGDLLKRRGSLPESEALPIILKVADALGYMHKQNRFHLDVKPANIMLRSDCKVVLIDFGSSKQYAEVDGENTTTLVPCYTPGYAPSEQMNPKPTAFTAATDVYALGATLYKMLTGQTPPSAIDLLNNDETLSPLPQEISQNVIECVEKAMIPQRNKRMQNVDEFVALLNSEKIAAPVVETKPVISEGVKAQDTNKLVEEGIAFYNEGYYDSALGRWKKAAEQGSAVAFYHIGVCYAKGQGVKQDSKKAFEWYIKSAEQGYVEAQNLLAECYAKGEGVKQNKEEAVRFYRKAAEQGSAEAQFNLAKCYAITGEGVEYNMEEATRWYRKAAEQDHVEAQKILEKLKMEAKAKEVVPRTWGKKVLGEEPWDGLPFLFLCFLGGSVWLFLYMLEKKTYYYSNYDPFAFALGIAGLIVSLIILLFFIRSILEYKRRVKKYKAEHPDDPVNGYLSTFAEKLSIYIAIFLIVSTIITGIYGFFIEYKSSTPSVEIPYQGTDGSVEDEVNQSGNANSSYNDNTSEISAEPRVTNKQKMLDALRVAEAEYSQSNSENELNKAEEKLKSKTNEIQGNCTVNELREINKDVEYNKAWKDCMQAYIRTAERLGL